MKEYQVVIHQESAWTAFIPWGWKINPVKFAQLLNRHWQDGWSVKTCEREIRRTLIFFTVEAMVVIMERDKK